MRKKVEHVITLDEITGVKDSKPVETKNNSMDVSEEVTEDRFLKNPLPLPKRREHTGMDFAITIKDDDDFDLKDMTGIDFFDFN